MHGCKVIESAVSTDDGKVACLACRAKTPEKKHGGLARAVSIPGHALLTALQTVKEQNAVLADHPHAEAYRHMEVPILTLPQLIHKPSGHHELHNRPGTSSHTCMFLVGSHPGVTGADILAL